jgi:hypothetical protein
MRIKSNLIDTTKIRLKLNLLILLKNKCHNSGLLLNILKFLNTNHKVMSHDLVYPHTEMLAANEIKVNSNELVQILTCNFSCY